jgi:hypothetical protein
VRNLVFCTNSHVGSSDDDGSTYSDDNF